MRALRLAAQALGLSARELQLLEVYIEHTFDADWTAGGEPIVITPVVELAEALGVTERQVRNIEQALMCRGLITFRDCGNHLRRGRRDPRTGKLVHGYGPSLAPVAARFTEIDALGARSAQDRFAARQARLAIAALRRRIRADIEALRDAGRISEADAAAESLDREPSRQAAATPVAELERRRARLKALASRLAIILGEGDPGAATAPTSARAEVRVQPPVQRPKREFLKERSGSNVGLAVEGESLATAAPSSPAVGKGREPSCAASEVGRRTPEEGRGLRDRDGADDRRLGGANDRRKVTHGMERVTVDLIAAAAPTRFTAYLDLREPLTWPAIVDAAAAVCRELRIAAADWGEACHALGRNAAAVAVLLLDARTPTSGRGSGVGNPAAYLRAMAAYGREGRLRLDASVFALVRQGGSKAAGGRRGSRRRSCGAGGVSGEPHATSLSQNHAVYP